MAPMGKQYDPLKELDEQDKKYQQEKQSAQETKKPTEKPADKKSANSGSWFGGFLSKLAPKPKNQMILPDDRDPSVRVQSCQLFLHSNFCLFYFDYKVSSKMHLGIFYDYFCVVKGDRGFTW